MTSKYFAFPTDLWSQCSVQCLCSAIGYLPSEDALSVCICWWYETEVQCVHTSSMSINCGTNRHFCRSLIHALGTECRSDIIIPIFDPQLTFKSQLEQLEGCELLRQIVKQVRTCFLSGSRVSLSRKGVSHFASKSPSFLSRFWNKLRWGRDLRK